MSDALNKYADLLAGNQKALANLGTVMPNGAPQVTPVWFDYDGKFFRVNSAKGRVKDRNMRRNPAVSLAIVDPANAALPDWKASAATGLTLPNACRQPSVPRAVSVLVSAVAPRSPSVV